MKKKRIKQMIINDYYDAKGKLTVVDEETGSITFSFRPETIELINLGHYFSLEFIDEINPNSPTRSLTIQF